MQYTVCKYFDIQLNKKYVIADDSYILIDEAVNSYIYFIRSSLGLCITLKIERQKIQKNKQNRETKKRILLIHKILVYKKAFKQMQ